MDRLHGMGSPNVVKPVIMLEEVGHEFEFVHENLFSDDEAREALKALNLNGKVPVYVPEGEAPIIESGAILIYLAERFKQFIGDDTTARLDVLQWLIVQMSTIGPMLGQLNHFVFYTGETEPYALKRYTREAGRIYAMLNARLSTVPYLAGKAYSIADMATYPWLDYMQPHGFDLADYPAMQDWATRMAARPAVQRARQLFDDIRPNDQNMYAAASPDQIERVFGKRDGMVWKADQD